MKLLSRCPFVMMCAVCNNVAMGRDDANSDIDLFFVMKSGRLFTGRTIVTLFLHVLGVRRYKDKISGRFCLSFFVDDNDLDFSRIAIKDDYYLAYWCKTMIPFIDRGVIEKFEEANKWVPELFVRQDYLLNARKPFGEFVLGGKFGDFLEKVLGGWQIRRALSKMSLLQREHGIIVNKHMLKFHDVDKREKLREEMKKVSGISF